MPAHPPHVTCCCVSSTCPQPDARPVVLREPFSAFTVIEVAWFLRLAYCLDEAQAEGDLQQMGTCLSAVLRMSHALDAPRLLKKVEKHIAGGLLAACSEGLVLYSGMGWWGTGGLTGGPGCRTHTGAKSCLPPPAQPQPPPTAPPSLQTS